MALPARLDPVAELIENSIRERMGRLVETDAINILLGRREILNEFKWADAERILRELDEPLKARALEMFSDRYAKMSAEDKLAMDLEAEAAMWPEQLRRSILDLGGSTRVLSNRIQAIQSQRPDIDVNSFLELFEKGEKKQAGDLFLRLVWIPRFEESVVTSSELDERMRGLTGEERELARDYLDRM